MPLTKYDPLSGARSLNFCVRSLSAWYLPVLSASVSLYSNPTLIDRSHTASRHAGVTAVAPAVPAAGLYSQGVPAMTYGFAKGSVSAMSALSSARADALEKRREGRRRVPRASSKPTACSVGFP